MDTEKLNMLLEEVVREERKNDFSEEEKIRAAYALNMCMVSISQIIDYNDLYVLEQEYDGILNNLNLEMMPKDEALLKTIKQILDAIVFFKMQEGDSTFIDREYQQKMKNAIWNAVPNFGLIVSGGNPVSMAVSLASQVGIGYMNYRRAKSENRLEYEKQRWQLQRSAIEQFSGLRRELFDTAWRLADTYNFPDSYRLTERQIKQYDEILMDNDEIRKYERLTSIKEFFIAYPPFWYHYGSTANHIARDMQLPLSCEARDQYKKEAIKCFEQYWKSNKYALLREDFLASSCALEHIDLLDVKKDRQQIGELLDKAVRFSGMSNDILQLCAVAYMRIGERNAAADILRNLVNENYNIVVNAQILSGLYVNKALHDKDGFARSQYETLATRVNPDYLLRLPLISESVSESELTDEFSEKQEELLKTKFSSVVVYSLNDLSVKLGKLIPAPGDEKILPDYYYTADGFEQRAKDWREIFGSHSNKRKKNEYLDKLASADFINNYFNELNIFFDSISMLSCIRDRQLLQFIIKNKISELARNLDIDSILKRIEEKTVTDADLCILWKFTSTGVFSEFSEELLNQIETSILGMNELSQYAAVDASLKSYCMERGIPDPDELISKGFEAKTDFNLVHTYFGPELLVKDRKNEQEQYNRIANIIKNHLRQMNSINDKKCAYFHDAVEFNSYFESSKFKNHKDVLQKTIAVLDDKSVQNVDLLFAVDGIVPIIRGGIKETIPYLSRANESIQKKAAEIMKDELMTKKETALFGAIVSATESLSLAFGKIIGMDTKGIDDILLQLQPMIDEIAESIINNIS